MTDGNDIVKIYWGHGFSGRTGDAAIRSDCNRMLASEQIVSNGFRIPSVAPTTFFVVSDIVSNASIEDPAKKFVSAMVKLAAGDLRNARRLMKMAAEENYLPALRLQALFVEHGVGGNPDAKAALPWLEKAALMGDADACIKLAHWHIVRRDNGLAKYWLRKSGDIKGRLMLARLYAKSRSARATFAANVLLTGFGSQFDRLSKNERIEYDALDADLKRRSHFGMKPIRRSPTDQLADQMNDKRQKCSPSGDLINELPVSGVR